MSLHGDHEHGAAWRRRQRRLRMHWRHEQLTLQMLLATHEHHVPRGHSRARSGKWEPVALHGQVPEHPTPQVAGTEYFFLNVEDWPATGSRPDRLAGVRPQERVQQHPVDQIVDTAPALPILDVPVPLIEEQLVDVPSVSSIRCVLLPSRLSKCPRSSSSASRREPRFASRSWRNIWWKSPDDRIIFFVIAANCGAAR